MTKHKIGAVAIIAAAVIGLGITVPILNASAQSLKTITATGGLDQKPPTCGAGEQLFAFFNINQIDMQSDAPPTITVSFADGSSATYSLLTFEPGGVAHYQGPAPAMVTGATTMIYVAWDGEFVLSHYFCGSGPPPTTTTTSSTTTTTEPVTPTTKPSAPTTTTTKPSGVTPSGVSPTSGAGAARTPSAAPSAGAPTPSISQEQQQIQGPSGVTFGNG